MVQDIHNIHAANIKYQDEASYTKHKLACSKKKRQMFKLNKTIFFSSPKLILNALSIRVQTTDDH